MITLSLLLLLVFCQPVPDKPNLADALAPLTKKVNSLQANVNSQIKDVRDVLTKETRNLSTRISSLDSQVKNLPTVPTDVVTKKELEESFTHVQSLLDAIQMPDVSQFLKTEDFDANKATLKTNMDSLQKELATLKTQMVTQTEGSEALQKLVNTLKSKSTKLKSEVTILKSAQKRIEQESERQDARIERVAKKLKKQAADIKELREQSQQDMKTQFAKLKEDLKEELKKDVHGVFASMAAELGYLFSLVKDSYTYVTYDIATRLGFKKQDVDSVFEAVSKFFSNVWQGMQDLFFFVREAFFEFLDLAKEKVPIILAFIRDNTKDIWGNISEYCGVAWEKISEFSSYIWRQMQFYGEKGMSAATEQFQEMQKYDVDDFKNAGMNAANEVKAQYEGFKRRSDVQSVLKAVSQQVKQVLPDKSQAEIDGYVEIGFLAVCVTMLLLSLYLFMRLFCSCLCRKRSKLDEPSVEAKGAAKVITEVKEKKDEKKKATTPKKGKKTKGRK